LWAAGRPSEAANHFYNHIPPEMGMRKGINYWRGRVRGEKIEEVGGVIGHAVKRIVHKFCVNRHSYTPFPKFIKIIA